MQHINFPPPADEQAFERLVAELAAPVLNARGAELNGRRGQAQQGVDVNIELHTDELVGIQCKLTTKALTLAVVKAEVAQARNYQPALDRFIVATTSRSDARLQEAVRKLPKEKFSVSIWSWDQINDWLNRFAAAGISYVQHVLLGARPAAERAHAEALRIALDRPAFLRAALAEHNFDHQIEAIQDTSKFLRTGYLYTRDRQFVTGVLPLRSYSEEYVKLADPVKTAIDNLDSHLRKSIRELRDYNHSKHAESAAILDVKRIKVLTVANKVFAAQGVDPIPITR